VGGHAQAQQVEAIARQNRIPVWCGGMLESGVGRAHNIAMATLAGFTLPGDVSASARYWHQDIIDPVVTVTPNGTIKAPDKPGIGFEVNRVRIDRATVRSERITG
jgi:O-succinylbenzoate synthase